MASLILLTTLHIILIASISHLAQAGTCWMSMSADGFCGSHVKSNVTQGKCCDLTQTAQGEKGVRFYSDKDMDVGELVQAYRTNIMPKCQPACPGSCGGNICTQHEKCKHKKGVYRCVCQPNCAENKIGYKGEICGTDGKTYRSHCSLLRQNCRKDDEVTVAYVGPCKVSSCEGVICLNSDEVCVVNQYNLPLCQRKAELVCSSKYRPVCGTDNRVYKSICHMGLESGGLVKLQHHGECGVKGLSCHTDRNCKQCHTDSVSGSPVCRQRSERLHECNDVQNSEPKVCANDGQTYKSECDMKACGWRSQTYLRVDHVSPCEASRDTIMWTIRSIRNRERQSKTVFTGYSESDDTLRGMIFGLGND